MENKDQTKNYKKLSLMLTISFVIMYTVMFFNVDRFDHIYLNLNRTYMSLLMVTPMAVIMMLIMSSMFMNKKLNIIFITGSILLFILSFIGLRDQSFVGDKNYMQGMIPHHSSAILVSKAAVIEDPELQELAKEIIRSQEEEIAQMKKILERLNN
jgi:amino acid transporter